MPEDIRRDGRRRTLRSAVLGTASLLVVLLSGLALLATPAFAEGWLNKGNFGTVQQPTFEIPAGLAIDPATHDLLVIDIKARTVSRFHEDGTPADFSALGTNTIDGKSGPAGCGEGGNPACEPCPEEPASCDRTPQNGILSTEANPLPEPGHAEFEAQVAVAPPGAAGGTEGDIYVTDAYHHFVDVFAPSGEYIGQRQFGFPCGVATSPTGDLFVGSFEAAKGVYRLTPSAPAQFTESAGSPLTTSRPHAPCQVAAGAGATQGNVFSVNYVGAILKTVSEGGEEGVSQYEFAPEANVATVDPATGHVFAGEGGQLAGAVRAFDASGTSGATEVSHFEVASEVRGIAVDERSETVYVTRAYGTQVEVFSHLILPTATTEPASGVGNLSATLHGQVSAAGGSETSCVFEFTSLAEFERNGFAEASSVPCSPAGPFTGSATEAVEAHLEGLQSGYHYRFRLTATNTGGGVAHGEAEALEFEVPTVGYPPEPTFGTCPNDLFRTGQGALLPDCRAYEQATEIDKNGTDAGGTHDLVQAASNGEAVTFYAQTGLPGGRGAQEYPTYMARRQSGTWRTQGLLPPATYGEGAAASLGRTPDLTYNVTVATKLGAGPTLLIEDTRTGAIETMVPYFPGGEAESFAYDGASSDGSRVFFESTLPVTGETPTGQDNLYVWERASQSVHLAGVLPGGGPPPGGSFGGPYNWIQGQPANGGAMRNYYVAAAHAVSSDGDRIYFTAGGTGQILLRRGLASGTPSTMIVSESHKTNGSGPGGTDPHGPKPAIFAEASEDGSKAFFMSSEELTDNANTGTADQGMDLYRYEPAGGAPRLTDLTADAADPNGAEVQGVLGVDRTGTVVYFVANGVLAPGARTGNCDNSLGDTTVRTCSIYRYDAASTPPTLTFVARVDGTEGFLGFEPSHDVFDWSPLSSRPDGLGHPTERTARVSADGRVLLFSSVLPLTGRENTSPNCQGGVKKNACREFFRYEAPGDVLDCVTCDPTGSIPVGAPSFAARLLVNVLRSPTGIRSGILLRNLSADGSRVFFQTPDKLVAGDTNGDAGCPAIGLSVELRRCQDVYEWEAHGSGSCTAATFEGGCLYLLSSGRSSRPSYFADADKSGADAFFYTASQLVPADRDELFDIYDAREEGGLPSQFVVPAQPCTGEEACRAAAAAPPTASSPGSASFAGQGNVKPKTHKKKHRKHHRKHHHTGARQPGQCKRGAKGKCGHGKKEKHRRANRGNGGGK